jgi:tRNA nucleotidyltransferase (CCA-adding enzyme)
MATIKNRRIESILLEALGILKPSSEEIKITNAFSNQIMGRLRDVAQKDVDIIMAGSVSRGTQIRGSSDIDIFMLFSKTSNSKAMEDKGMRIAKRIVNKKNGEHYKIKYAEHPYLQLISNNPPIKADIVPAFKIKDSYEMGSSVDRTQLHNVFVMENLTEKQRDDVRLLKGFLKFHSIYGAEAKIEGFSGYLSELLIYNYGSFMNTLSSISRLKLPISIDPKSRSILNTEKNISLKSDFVVLDPTDENRNVAAAVSKESLSKFILISRRFLKNPSIDFFYGNEYSDNNSKSRLNALRENFGFDMYNITFKVSDISEEILWQQSKKLTKQLEEILQKYSFNPIISLIEINGSNGIISIFLNKYELTSTVRQGPDVFMENAVDSFMGKNQHVFIKGYKLMSLKRTEFNTPINLMRSMFKSNAITIPSYIKKKSIRVSINKISEPNAKLIYRRYIELTKI